jgi:hypothetical protein
LQIVNLDDDDDSDIGIDVPDPPPDLEGNANDSLESSLYEIFERKLRERAHELHIAQNEIASRMIHNAVMDVIVGKCGFHGGALMALYACDVKQQVLFIKLF